MRPSDVPESGSLRTVDSFGYCERYLKFYENLLENLLERVRDPQMGARHFLKRRNLNSNLDLLRTHRIISVMSH